MAKRLRSHIDTEFYRSLQKPAEQLVEMDLVMLNKWLVECIGNDAIRNENDAEVYADNFLKVCYSAKEIKYLEKKFEKSGYDVYGVMVDVWQKQKNQGIEIEFMDKISLLQKEVESKSIDSYEKEIESLNQRLNDTMDLCQKSQSMCEDLHNNCNEAQSMCKSYQNMLDTTKNELSSALSELETTKQQLSATQVALEKERQNKGGVKMSNNNDIDEITQWEYKLERLNGSDAAEHDRLNKFGEQGWEIIGTKSPMGTEHYIMKRPKKKDTSQDYYYGR